MAPDCEDVGVRQLFRKGRSATGALWGFVLPSKKPFSIISRSIQPWESRSFASWICAENLSCLNWLSAMSLFMAKIDIPGYRVYLAGRTVRSGSSPAKKLPVGPDLEPSNFVDIPANDHRLHEGFGKGGGWVVFLRGDMEIARFALDQIAGYVDLSV
jgi:hypothetical protein